MTPEDEIEVKHQMREGTVDNARATRETIAAVKTLQMSSVQDDQSCKDCNSLGATCRQLGFTRDSLHDAHHNTHETGNPHVVQASTERDTADE